MEMKLELWTWAGGGGDRGYVLSLFLFLNEVGGSNYMLKRARGCAGRM